MELRQKIDRVLTEYNFDRMDFDEAKQELLNLHSVICRFLFIYVDGEYKLIKYVEANNQDEAERKVDDGWARVVQLEEDMQIVYNGI